MRKFDLRLFMNAIDFFQNGGAGWKHARRSDCNGWNVNGFVNLLFCLSPVADGCKPARRAHELLIIFFSSSFFLKNIRIYCIIIL
jgi:hypothetical protein